MTKTEPQTIAAIKRYRAMKMARLISRSYYHSRRGNKAEMYSLVGDELLSLGGIYIKFLQTIVLQSQNMLKYWRNPARLSIFENLSTEPLDIKAFLAEHLDDDADQLKSVSPEPFAAGSFGQVYMAKLDGQDVIIKVMRPQVAELLKFDLKLLRYFWRVCNRYFAASKSLDLNIAFNGFASQTLNEVRLCYRGRVRHRAIPGLSRPPEAGYPQDPSRTLPAEHHRPGLRRRRLGSSPGRTSPSGS